MTNVLLERLKRRQWEMRKDKLQRIGLWVVLGVCCIFVLCQLLFK